MLTTHNGDLQLTLDRLRIEAVPLFAEILRKGNPTEFDQWGGNCCRQTAMFAYIFCLLNITFESGDNLLDVYEARFECDYLNKGRTEFDHAWLHLKTDGENYVIDYLPSVHGMRVLRSEGNKVYWGNHAYFRNVREIDRRRIDCGPLLSTPEFYTGKPLSAIYHEVIEEMNREGRNREATE